MPPTLPVSRSAVSSASWLSRSTLVALGDQAGRSVEAPQVDRVEPLDSEGREVGLDLGAQLLGPLRGDERAPRVPVGAHLGDEDEVVG
ncbi:hypothetical protein AB0D27_27990 [Streptomyces sp. NPDC048415]|uniref:hypothetical protein n=1 Tax=Streptomyces sp. NPDC048415 TaxID=3154822 RepID=UPI00341F3532